MTQLTRLLALVLLITAASAAAREIRTWTSASGATIEAAYLEQQFDLVILQTTDGEKIKIRADRLSADDQRYLAELRQVRPPQRRSDDADDAPIPPALAELFGRRLINAKGQKVSTAVLAGKKIGLYFSASWCPPCRAFTPVLVNTYNQLKADAQPFEVVLVTSDQDAAAMRAYMRSYDMPWLAIPFGDKAIPALNRKYSISGIPALVIINDDAQTLSSDARSQVTSQGPKAYPTW